MSKDINKQEVGYRIKNIRLSLGKNTRQFGELFSPPASDSIVSRWESGKSIPNPQRLKIIAEKGNTTTEHLLFGDFRFAAEEIPLVERLIDLFLSYNLKVVETVNDEGKVYYRILFPYDEYSLEIDTATFIKRGEELLSKIKASQDRLVTDFLEYEVDEIDQDYNWPDEFSDYY